MILKKPIWKHVSEKLKMNTYSNDFSYLLDCDKITAVHYL